MRKFVLVAAVAALCGGCSYTQLKAPCADKGASLSFDSATDVPCDNRQPVNAAALGFGWSQQEE